MKIKLNEQQLQKLVEWLKTEKNLISEDAFKSYYEIPSSRSLTKQSSTKETNPLEPKQSVDNISSLEPRKRGRPRKNPIVEPDVLEPEVNVDITPDRQKSGRKGRPFNSQKIFDKIMYYINKNVFDNDQLTNLGNSILDKITITKYK